MISSSNYNTYVCYLTLRHVMAGTGPRSKHRAKALRSTNNASTTQMVSVPVINMKDISQLGKDSVLGELAPFFKDVETLKELTLKFINIAKNNNTRERELNIDIFFGEHQFFFESAMERVVSTVGFHFLQHQIPYQHMDATLQSLSQQLKALSESKKTEDENYSKELNILIARKMKDSELLFLLGFHKVNVWHYLLQHPNAQKDRETMVHNLMQDLAPATSDLIARFMQSTLSEHHYYFYYQMLQEKINWFELYADEYQNLLYKQIVESSGKLEQIEEFKYKIASLLRAYRLDIAFLGLFGQQEKARNLKAKALVFIDKLLPVYSKIGITNESLEEYKRGYNDLETSFGAEGQSVFHVFKLLNDFYTKEWNQTAHSVNPKMDLVLSVEQVKSTKAHLESLAKSTSMPGISTLQASSFLAIVSNFIGVPPNQRTRALLSSILELVIAFMKIIKQDPSLGGTYGKTIQGMLKQIADDVTKQLSSLAKEVEVDTLTDALKELSLKTVAQGVTKEHEEKFKQDKKKQDDSFEVQSQELRSQIERERGALAQRLQEENAAKLKALETSHAEQLNAEKVKGEQQVAKLKAEKEGQFEAKKAELSADYQKNVAELEAQLKKDKQKNHADHQRAQNALSVQHKAELDALEKKYKTELAIHTGQLETKIQQTKAQHQQSMAALVTEQQIKLKDQTTQHQLKLAKLKEQQQLKLAALQAELSAVELQEQAKMREVEASEQAALDKMVSHAEADLEQLKQKLFDDYRKRQETFDSQRLEKQRELEEKTTQVMDQLQQELQLKNPVLKSVHSYKPFTQIWLPNEKFVLQELEAFQIESYLVGGWSRNRLMGLPIMFNEDIDIIVNCSADQLPLGFKSKCWQNPNQPKHFKLGKIDFWCEPWVSLKEFLAKKDVSINTFVCTHNGDVYDLLDAQKDLSAPTLRFLGDPKVRFVDDPSLMLRLIRFSNQLQKSIEPIEDVIKQHANRIKYLPIGVYLTNLQKLFISDLANINFSTVLRLGILSEVFPTLPTQMPPYSQFWEFKLNEFSHYPARFNYYHVLALFLVMPLAKSHPTSADLSTRTAECIESFLGSYQGIIEEGEKEKIRKTLSSILLSECGFYVQYLQFAHPPVVSHEVPAGGLLLQFNQGRRNHRQRRSQEKPPAQQHTEDKSKKGNGPKK